jgi:hypothetical protein
MILIEATKEEEYRVVEYEMYLLTLNILKDPPRHSHNQEVFSK